VTFALVKPDKGIRKRSARRVSSVSNTTGDDYGIDAPTRAGSGRAHRLRADAGPQPSVPDSRDPRGSRTGLAEPGLPRRL